MEECEEAARQLGLSDTEAQQIKGSSSPPFCYLYTYRGVSLRFNKISNASAPCDWDSSICICKRGKGPFMKDIRTKGEQDWHKGGRRHSEERCVDLVLEIRPKCGQGGRGSKIPKILRTSSMDGP